MSLYKENSLHEMLIAEAMKILAESNADTYGGYSPACLKRKIMEFLSIREISTVKQLHDRASVEKNFTAKLMQSITVNYTEMFRDPWFFRSVCATALPYLSTYPSINIWHVGCSTGEEVYSLAILLHELDLLERSKIHATDISIHALNCAREGSYSVLEISEYDKAYQAAGGQGQFRDYYRTSGDRIIFKEFILKHLQFHEHNITSEQPPGQFHMVLCRNVLIYFNQRLRNRACKMLSESVQNLGYLAIGANEKFDFSGQLNDFSVIDPKGKIFRKVSYMPAVCKNDDEITSS